MHNLTLSDCINSTVPCSLQASDANGITQNLLGRKRSASDVSLEQDNGNAYASRPSLLAEQNKQQNTGKATSIKLLLLMNKTNFFIVLQSACIVYAVNLYSLMYGTCTHSTIVTKHIAPQ